MKTTRLLATILTVTIALMSGLLSSAVYSATEPKMVDKITITFAAGDRSHTMTFTNVGDMVEAETIDDSTKPHIIYYYPNATVMSFEDFDNTDNFMNGFFVEADYHFGEDGIVKANTVYNIREVYEKLGGILMPGESLDETTGIMGMGPIFLIPWDFDYINPNASIFDFEVKESAADSAPELTTPTSQGLSNSDIKVIVNGTALTFDQPPIIENSRTLVPLRIIFEALGAEVDWDQTTQTVTAIKGDATVTLTIGSDMLNKNGEQIKLDVPAKIVGSRTLVPARAVAESFGAEVGWDQNTQTVTITN